MVRRFPVDGALRFGPRGARDPQPRAAAR
jgi:hypothetical protein